MTLEEIDNEMREIGAKIKPLQARADELRRLRGQMLSVEFVRNHRITADQVELSEGEGKPYWGHIQPFSRWLAKNSKCRWAEWNGFLYERAELVAGRMDPNAVGRYGDVAHNA